MLKLRLRGSSFQLVLAAAFVLAVALAASASAAGLQAESQGITSFESAGAAVSDTGESTTDLATVTLPVSSGKIMQLLGNPGFENGSASPAPWVPTTGVIDNSSGEAAHGGTWKAWMDGYGTAHTDTLYQQVTIPPTATVATLSFWLHIDTDETTTTIPFDTLNVQIRNTSNMLLATLATYSNLNASAGFAQKSFNLLSYRGQTIRIYLLAIEDSTSQTSFVVDDFAVNIQ